MYAPERPMEFFGTGDMRGPWRAPCLFRRTLLLVLAVLVLGLEGAFTKPQSFRYTMQVFRAVFEKVISLCLQKYGGRGLGQEAIQLKAVPW